MWQLLKKILNKTLFGLIYNSFLEALGYENIPFPIELM